MKFNTWKIAVLIGLTFFQCKKEVVEPDGPKELPLVWAKQVVVPLPEEKSCFKLLTITDQSVIALGKNTGDFEASLCAFNKFDGNLMWEFPGFFSGFEIEYLRNCTVVHGNTLYYLDVNSFNQTSTLYAIDLSMGIIRAQKSFDMDDVSTLSLSLHNDRIGVWMHTTKNGQPTCSLVTFDQTLQTTETLLSIPKDLEGWVVMSALKRWTHPSGQTYWVFSQRTNFVGAVDRKNNRYRYYAYNESLDALAWTTTVFKESIFSQDENEPLLLGNYLIEQTDYSVYCIDLTLGEVIWNKENENYPWNPTVSKVKATQYNAWAVVPSYYTKFGLLEPQTGNLLWEVDEAEVEVDAWHPTNEALFVLGKNRLIGYSWANGEVLYKQYFMITIDSIRYVYVDKYAGMLHDPIENRLYFTSCEGEMLCYQVE
ncbi:MAG: PQQ-binding-like beta-propeller repeat protein [Saprospiraceae bacterium]|nr:PQQ-binding-like beta-propeller repeat protein [Saprospiraceae bacterium]